jgi:iron complex transport system permease protein
LKTKDYININCRVTSGKDRAILFSILLITIICFFFLDIFFGSVSIKPAEVFRVLFNQSDSFFETIIMRFRVPKAATALLVGVALSISGLQMQTVFRNPMAGPYVLGISSGASLGVAIVILGFSSYILPGSIEGFGNWALVFAAWMGAGIVMILMMIITIRVRDIMTVLILGIMLASGISAIVSIMQYFSNETMLKAYVIWTMGSLGNLTVQQLQILFISVAIGIVINAISVKMLNALLLGDNYAMSIGVNVTRARTLIFISTSILAGSVTAFCGPIGFIGIAVPHIARILFKTSNHNVLIPATILIGGIIMLASDIISQIPGSDSVIPINSVTSLVGVPVVIWVIIRNNKINRMF